MPTAKEITHIRTLGIIAGGGRLPEHLARACEAQNIKPFIVGLEGQTDPALLENREHIWSRLGAAGKILKALKEQDIKDLVLIGSIHRPTLSDLRPDLKTTEFFARIGLKSLGDNGLLSLLRTVLEEDGFTLHGIHKFAQDLLAPSGPIGKYKPKKGDDSDIQRGLQISQELGRLDIGQSVIVQEGIVLGVEAIEGTSALIERCQPLKRKGRGGVLVKTCKPQQDRDMDLPTIGPDTIEQVQKCGLAGVVVQAGHSLIIDKEEVARLADKYKMFVIGVDIETQK